MSNEIKTLTERHKKFADDYIKTGEKANAYMRAYPNVKKMETAAAAATRLLKNVNVLTYIEERNKQLDDDNIADMKEVKRFWTNTMRDREEALRDRIKASECIARSESAFLEKVEHSGSIDINSKVKLIDKYLEDD